MKPEVDVAAQEFGREFKVEAVRLSPLRRPLESAQYTSEQFQRLIVDHRITCSMSRSGNVWDNAAMESFFSSLKAERTARKVYRMRDDARADVFDYIERFYNRRRRHSTLGSEPRRVRKEGRIS